MVFISESQQSYALYIKNQGVVTVFGKYSDRSPKANNSESPNLQIQ